MNCAVNSLTSGHCGLKDHYGSITSLASSTSMISPQVQPLKDHYGSITSLASSTSMISPQVQPLKGHYGTVSNL